MTHCIETGAHEAAQEGRGSRKGGRGRSRGRHGNRPGVVGSSFNARLDGIVKAAETRLTRDTDPPSALRRLWRGSVWARW